MNEGLGELRVSKTLFYPTNNQRNAVLERIFKEIRSIFIPKENPKQSAEDIKH